MLSINIPVYNYTITELVSELVSQAADINKPFEIRVYDDGSSEEIKKKNREIKDWNNVIYTELEENSGRAAIRNKMGFESKFENLIFIDADSMPVSKNYLGNYIQNIKPGRVLCGGTTYKNEPPLEHEKYLRWFYGTHREAISAKLRNSKKGFIITSNNFLIEKNVFERIHFREDIKKYGHEDTLLGYDLFKNGIEIFHIENPLEHTGLEDSTTFINKTKTALESLRFISTQLLKNEEEFNRQVNFLNGYHSVIKLIPKPVLRKIYHVGQKIMENNLMGKNPRLRVFDLYKLAYYSTL